MVQVLVSEFMDSAALEGFGAAFEVRYDPELANKRKDLLDRIARAKAIIVRNRTQVDAELLEAAPDLKVIGRLGVGLDNIDMDACTARGVRVFPATGANTVSVAEYVVTSALILVRKVFSSSPAMITGDWPRSQLGAGGEVMGRQVGLIGFGAIAQAAAARFRALDMRIAAHDPYLPKDDPAWNGVQNANLTDLLATSDVISLHVPLTPQTKGMIDADAIARMKPGSVLINTARGGILDEAAVAASLSAGHLGGAALDVFEEEPLNSRARALFADVPNLILTPHISGVTGEGNIRVSQMTVENVRAALIGEMTKQDTKFGR